MANVYINRKEEQALHDAWEQVNNVHENFTGDEDSFVGQMLVNTKSNLQSIINKLKSK